MTSPSPTTSSNPTNLSYPTIGILGGGQLGRMTALAAIRMGMHVKTLSPSPSGPVAPLGEAHVGDWNDEDVVRAFMQGCDVVTVESEWAPAEVAEAISQGHVPVWPSSATLKTIRHKGVQKNTLKAKGIPMGDYTCCKTLDEAQDALTGYGGHAIAKRYEGSYDGYGNASIRSSADLSEAWSSLAADDGMLMEAFVPFIRELAVLVARSPNGETVVYPVVDTEQKDHRCHAVSVPAAISVETEIAAREIALTSATTVQSVGILGVELFELADGSVMLNELAPRPHNTGHYTIEACHTSQFENHARAILGLPLGDPGLRVPAAVMINILGERAGPVRRDGLVESLSNPNASLHIYGKLEARPKRKMGHITVTADDVPSARAQAESAAASIKL